MKQFQCPFCKRKNQLCCVVSYLSGIIDTFDDQGFPPRININDVMSGCYYKCASCGAIIGNVRDVAEYVNEVGV